MEHDDAALDAYLSASESAIKASDTEFALKICKNAANFISDPRIPLIMGKALKEQGDSVDALCCFRASLTMDTGVNGSAPTASQLEQLIKADRVGRAMQLYRESAEFREKRSADFHIQVGKALRSVPGHREEAVNAFTRSALCGSDCEALGYYEIGDTHYEARELEEAMRWYGKALKSDPAMALAISGIANCLKDQGFLEDAVSRYTEAHEVSPSDPTFVFNLAQAFEYVQRYREGIECIECFNASLKPGDMITVNHFAIPLLYVKLLFVAGPEYHGKVPAVLSQIATFPEVAKNAVMKLATHWAYYYFLSHLLQGDPSCGPPADDTRPLYFVGDSHVLTLSWREMIIADRKVIAVPKLVTGLKAWHLRDGFKFLTVSNLAKCIESIPRGADGKREKAVFVCGEIDCREGLPNAIAKNKYDSMEKAVNVTVDKYLSGLERLETQHDIDFVVLSVCPPTNPGYKSRILATKLFNAELKARLPPGKFADVSQMVSTNDGVVRSLFSCDGTHMNRKAAELIEGAVNAAISAR